ncbi:MAG: DUF1778 domain-containing protein [Bacteroidetes bacterium]|nr:DUF1778 domain-containing protein [Bacteroidota bacterium]
MSTSSHTRFDARLSREEKNLLEQAASLAGFKSLSDFILTTARERAIQVIRQNQQILQSDADRDAFFNALLLPPEPNDALKQAAIRYFQHTQNKQP